VEETRRNELDLNSKLDPGPATTAMAIADGTIDRDNK